MSSFGGFVLQGGRWESCVRHEHYLCGTSLLYREGTSSWGGAWEPWLIPHHPVDTPSPPPCPLLMADGRQAPKAHVPVGQHPLQHYATVAAATWEHPLCELPVRLGPIL